MIKLNAAGIVIAFTSLIAAASAHATEKGTLLIWINGDKAYAGLAAIGKRFEQETGCPVIVQHPDTPEQKFIAAGRTNDGPDILFWAHDRSGEFAAMGLLAPVTPAAATHDDVLPIAWDAFTYKRQIWGYPIALEAIGLVYNTDLVPTPPKRFEDIPALAAHLAKQATATDPGKPPVQALAWSYEVPYFAWPLMAAGGAAAFGKTPDGDYDVATTGANSQSAVDGAQTIVDLVGEGVLPRPGAPYPAAEAAMADGRAAMLITGPWAWKTLRRKGINFAVAPVPTVKGKAAVPYVGVLGAMISARSPNKDLAANFMENYVMTPDGLRTLDHDVAIGVPASRRYFEELRDNPLIVATMDNVQAGVPMPNIPDMSRFWAAIDTAIGDFASGRKPPKTALDTAAARIRK